ncbi:DNA-directed RNA polymerase IV subunit 1 isoform X2 [Ziziphus jujuba]|uniref:DNA-directed RNA polymerase subunit n=1 Tax=Ziziphus jujuba TaxID=326968 RepID=A0A6P4BRI1_ZIZJJ|nr:DNA-directed RNA polymerase IV subunit 1 isoform X2 [Ziziphus jujuba]
MGSEFYEDDQVPLALIDGLTFYVSTQADTEKMSVISIDAANGVTDPRLGVPNPSSQCSTCGASDLKSCEGHFGHIKFPFTILHPYFLSEVVQILNKICPRCKSTRQSRQVKGPNSITGYHQPTGCSYCIGSSSTMKFKVSSKDLFSRSTITVEVNDKLLEKFKSTDDFWDFIPKDAQQEESCMKPNKRVLSHAQVHYLLNAIDPDFIKKYVARTDSLFLNCFPVTPNSHRVTEFINSFSNGQRLIFDERTRAYKKLVDFRGAANDLGSRVLDCLKISKLSIGPNPSKDLVIGQQKSIRDSPSKTCGLRWIKDVILGKRSDHCFRMVVVGDPNIKLNEIGIPCHIAERMHVSERLNRWNLDKSDGCWNLRLIEKGEIYVRRNNKLVRVRPTDELHIGDTIYRPLSDGDILLINRPPSIHQHSLIALSVKVLPITSVVSINPICCSPFRGDFDGDCLHGYVPQSVDTRVELRELVALDRQLTNRQSGRNLLSFSQDSLTAAHLIMEDSVLLNLFEMQQLEMFCLHQRMLPAIIKAPSLDGPVWTGKQLFSMLLPSGFDYVDASNGVCIRNGELVSFSEGSSWLRDIDGNLFQSLIKYCLGHVIDILHAAQEVLCEWLSMRGLSVSLADLYLTADSHSREKMMDEIFFGLQEAEQTCAFKRLVNYFQEFLIENNTEDNQRNVSIQMEYLLYKKQTSAELSQVSIDAFKQVFRDIQSLAYKYGGKDNSLMVMFKAGSKGNLLKLVQNCMCLGLQHSLIPLSFGLPHQLSCIAWNNHKACGLTQKVDASPKYCKSYIPCAVVESSFLSGLNPLECFVHSVTCRDSSFSDNAELPGTLHRRLMYFLRDLYAAYDGTVRNAYGNQLVQFAYSSDVPVCSVLGSEPVGSLSACAISEAAYSALDQPISVLETSPLLNLKRVLECGSKKSSADQTMSLYLSEELGRQRHGFEYGALEVKDHLEGLIFSEVVSTVMIMFSPQTGSKTCLSPWVCHFHICKDILRRRRLNVHSIIDSLHLRCKSAQTESKTNFSKLQIMNRNCSEADTHEKDKDPCCIVVSIPENSKNSSIELDMVQNVVIPSLLGTVIKGFREIKKVDILWKDRPKISKAIHGSSGELYLRVSMSGSTSRTRAWSMLLNDSLPIMDMIDWSRSHPDNIKEFCVSYGIDAGWKYFLNNLESAISDIGKTILPEHLLLVADSLSVTGQFVGLNAKGIAQQKEHASSSSPFMRACFSTPGAHFIKAAKAGVTDRLQGSLDALAWGKVPAMGTGGRFDIIYSGKGHEIAKPADVYDLLGSQISSDKQNEIKMSTDQNHTSNKYDTQFLYGFGGSVSKGFTKLGIAKSFIRKFFTPKDVQNLSHKLKHILHKYPIDHKLDDADKSTLMMTLYFHPRRDVKVGAGIQDIKVVNHPDHENSRCFMLLRTDGTSEDFSYHKCVHGALEIVAPVRAKSYWSKLSQQGFEEAGCH